MIELCAWLFLFHFQTLWKLCWKFLILFNEFAFNHVWKQICFEFFIVFNAFAQKGRIIIWRALSLNNQQLISGDFVLSSICRDLIWFALSVLCCWFIDFNMFSHIQSTNDASLTIFICALWMSTTLIHHEKFHVESLCCHIKDIVGYTKRFVMNLKSHIHTRVFSPRNYWLGKIWIEMKKSKYYTKLHWIYDLWPRKFKLPQNSRL